MDTYPTNMSSSFEEVAGIDIKTLNSRYLFGTNSQRKVWPYLAAFVLGVFFALGTFKLITDLFNGHLAWEPLVALLVLGSLLLKVLDVTIFYDIDVYTTGLAFKERYMLGFLPGYWRGVTFDKLLYVDARGRKISLVHLDSEQRVELARGMPKETMRRFADMLTSYQRRGDIPNTVEIKLS